MAGASEHVQGPDPDDGGDVVVARLAAFWAAPETAGVFSDFDGTLAEIVPDPAMARPVDGAVDLLAELAGRFGCVGVISGRPASFLRHHLGGRGLFLTGLYGLESVEDGVVKPVPGASRWRPVVEEVAAQAEAELPPGIGVERKGFSVTVHYRNDPSKEAMAHDWAWRAATINGLALHTARMSFELRPPLDRDKGTVLRDAAAGLSAACFVGDDRGDLEAFDALDELATGGTTALRVAVDSPEAPSELLDRADLVVDGPKGTLAFLRRLLNRE